MVSKVKVNWLEEIFNVMFCCSLLSLLFLCVSSPAQDWWWIKVDPRNVRHQPKFVDPSSSCSHHQGQWSCQCRNEASNTVTIFSQALIRWHGRVKEARKKLNCIIVYQKLITKLVAKISWTVLELVSQSSRTRLVVLDLAKSELCQVHPMMPR